MYLYMSITKETEERVIKVGYIVTNGLDGIVNKQQEEIIISETIYLKYNQENVLIANDGTPPQYTLIEDLVSLYDIDIIYIFSNREYSYINTYFSSFARNKEMPSILTAGVLIKRCLGVKRQSCYNDYTLPMLLSIFKDNVEELPFQEIDKCYYLYDVITSARECGHNLDRTRSHIIITQNKDSSTLLRVFRLYNETLLLDVSFTVIDEKVFRSMLNVCVESYHSTSFSIVSNCMNAPRNDLIIVCEELGLQQIS